MKTFINFIKKSLIKRVIRVEIRALREVRALKKVETLLLSILNLFIRP